MTDSTIRQSMISAREEYIGIIRDELQVLDRNFLCPIKNMNLFPALLPAAIQSEFCSGKGMQ